MPLLMQRMTDSCRKKDGKREKKERERVGKKWKEKGSGGERERERGWECAKSSPTTSTTFKCREEKAMETESDLQQSRCMSNWISTTGPQKESEEQSYP